MSKKIKKATGLVLALVMIFSIFSTASSAASVSRVKNVSVSSADDDEINIKWTKIKGVTGYQVYIRKGSS